MKSKEAPNYYAIQTLDKKLLIMQHIYYVRCFCSIDNL